MMMKVTLAAFIALQATTSAFMVAPAATRPTFGLKAVSGAAKNAEDDLMLTLKVIMDHAERSATASKDQFISQMKESQKADEGPAPGAVDISIPYDAAAKNAYEAAGSQGDYAAFKTQFEADAVADVIAKNTDISIPYDAAAKNAFEAAGSKGDYKAFKTQFEADAVAAVIAKNAPAGASAAADGDISIPYDAAAKNAFEATGSKGDYQAFKTKFEADAVADVIAKNTDISIPYDAAAKNAFEAAGSKGDYKAFKTQFEAAAVADVTAKQNTPEPVTA